MITEDRLWTEYNISSEQLYASKITLDELNSIADDFQNKRDTKYKEIMNSFIKEYMEDIEQIKIHSYRTRLKDPEHLAAKIVRKRLDNYIKYHAINKDNYEKFVTDLIGIRCFILFKSDWIHFHNYILNCFENNPQHYIRDCLLDFDSDQEHMYIAEPPKAHIRNGDSRDIYEHALPPDCVIDDKIYRSVHYILKYKGVYIEIQVRTLFEEGWGEINHAIVYPKYDNDPILKQYTELLNRLTGLADEMGSYFNVIKSLELKYIENKNHISEDQSIDNTNIQADDRHEELQRIEGNNAGQAMTPQDCIENVLKQE